MDKRSRDWRHHWWPFTKQQDLQRIVINSFFYPNASSGQCIRCGLKIIPGLSPVRRALLNSGLFKGEVSYYPSDRIVYEELDLPERKTTDWEVPDEVLKQLRALPEQILEGMSVTTREGFLAIHLTLPDKSKASVFYLCERPYPLRAVFIQNGAGESTEVTEGILNPGPHTEILTIYQRLISIAEDNKRRRPDQSKPQEDCKSGSSTASEIDDKKQELFET
jgi:hypothetical protein